nr:dispanin subfamily A member 2b-like [Monopterus albus]
MDHGGQQAEAVPLQVGRYDVPPGQPGGPVMVQYTTVTISTDPPKDHIIWSIFNLVYGNVFCFGLAALFHSVKARDRKVAGDLNGARNYGNTARCLNIVATVLNFIGICSFIAIIVINVNVKSSSNVNAYHYNRRY